MIITDFNRGWRAGGPENPFAAIMGLAESRPAEPVTLPHDAMIGGPRAADAITGQGQGYYGAEDVEYTKTFTVDASLEGHAVWLAFEGAYMNTTVFVNETFILNWPNGYTDFTARIDGAVRYGQSNRVRVVVRNGMQRNSRWYAGGGIYRDVHLITAPPTRIALDGVRITTLDADATAGVIRVETDIEQEIPGRRSLRAVTTIRDADGAVVASRSGKVTLVGVDRRTATSRVDIADPQLWNIGRPNLYTCETVLETLDGEQLDSTTTTFGIRKLQLDGLRGLRINGESVKLRGGCVHHDSGILGSATFADFEDRRVRRLRDAGYNAIRSAHNPIGRAFLEACDRYGLVVMDEFTDSWNKTTEMTNLDYNLYFSEYWERDVERMVRRDYNHPSVIIYSIGNEIADIGDDVNAIWGFKLAEKIKSIDPDRYVTLAIQAVALLTESLTSLPPEALRTTDLGGAAGTTDTASIDVNTLLQNVFSSLDKIMVHPLLDSLTEQIADMVDIVGYNYAPVRYEIDHAKYPHRIFVGSEMSPQALPESWDLVQKHPFVLGDFAWTAWDYLGEVGIGRVDYSQDAQPSYMGSYPWIASYGGDFDILGNRRPRSFWREIVWGGRHHEPYLVVEPPQYHGKTPIVGGYSWPEVHPSWTWPGEDGRPVAVQVYSDADEVELLLNGTVVARTTVGTGQRKFSAEFDLTYQPGTLEAVAYIDGAEVGRSSLRTATGARLTATAETHKLRAGSNDLAFINIGFADQHGQEDLSIITPVTIEVTGPVTVQASGSANPKPEDSYRDLTHTPYWGKAMAVIRAGESTGAAQVTVTAAGHDPVTIDLTVD
ncbi:glycoside hydrolase family 2 TIM barrel-domain containing protein [Jatrophihabitans endophyticus]|uniref:glycoside hydrolase family 2 TIM barrel-domain containing protein n=1 Tax=Jatrophihabitans endophyticus TaxID=1206085 RepID=UPI0019DB7B86|nr:glycoside hydrolase family 2 TIM barrel-domain containing protein [Jatrophihabitans endophyticus]MBE7187607.1 DUF4982 domain-containing protein [Jatrophihabitans endophyticus]